MEIRIYSLVKSNLVTLKEVLKMKFKEFEKLEKFHILTRSIEKINHSSFRGKETTPQRKGGLVIKSNGEHTRT